MTLSAIMIVIFTVYIFSRIFKKHELSENIYNAKVSTFTVSSLVYYHISNAMQYSNTALETTALVMHDSI